MTAPARDSPGRATLAWIGATTIAALVGIILWIPWGLVFFHFALAIALTVTGPLLATTVWAAHRCNLPRPLSEIVSGAVVGALLCWMLAFLNPPIALGAACGALGGALYWLFAGMPR